MQFRKKSTPQQTAMKGACRQTGNFKSSSTIPGAACLLAWFYCQVLDENTAKRMGAHILAAARTKVSLHGDLISVRHFG